MALHLVGNELSQKLRSKAFYIQLMMQHKSKVLAAPFSFKDISKITSSWCSNISIMVWFTQIP